MPRPLDTAGLERAAVRHLQRFPCSEDRLVWVLKRRIRRADDVTDAERAALVAALPEVVAKMRRFGLVDDAAYAKALVESLHRKGKGRRAIRAKLRERMVPAELAQAAIEAMEEGTADPELEAAMNYARRRRIGPFHRDPDRRVERRQKDLAALARQGFGYGVARQVIDAEPE